jgi:hypothetical protein
MIDGPFDPLAPTTQELSIYPLEQEGELIRGGKEELIVSSD